jgi:hypothetical protein
MAEYWSIRAQSYTVQFCIYHRKAYYSLSKAANSIQYFVSMIFSLFPFPPLHSQEQFLGFDTERMLVSRIFIHPCQILYWKFTIRYLIWELQRARERFPWTQ